MHKNNGLISNDTFKSIQNQLFNFYIGKILSSSFRTKENHMAVILFVRIKSNLEDNELKHQLDERKPRFLDVPGLLQKIYGKDEKTGDVCGIYFFEDQVALDDFHETMLAQSISAAYEVQEIRQEAYDVLYSLRPDQGLNLTQEPMTECHVN